MRRRHWTLWWMLAMVAVDAAFYVVIRTGLTRRLADPALTEVQMVHAIVHTSLSYLLTGRAHGAFLLALIVALTFGLFSLSTPMMWRMVAFAVLSVSTAMLLGVLWIPQHFDPQIERANFMIVIISLPAMGLVASRLNHLRERLRSQNSPRTGAAAHRTAGHA